MPTSCANNAMTFHDTSLLSETNHNIADVEKWDGFTCFYSTDVDPKVMDSMHKKGKIE